MVTRKDAEIQTDQLKYTRRNEYVTLTSDRGSRTIVKQNDQIVASTAKPLRWSRITNAISGSRMSPIRLRP